MNKWPTQKCERNFWWTVDCCYCYIWQGRYFYNCYLNAICIGIVREARCKRVSTINCSTTIGSCVKNLVKTNDVLIWCILLSSSKGLNLDSEQIIKSALLKLCSLRKSSICLWSDRAFRKHNLKKDELSS